MNLRERAEKLVHKHFTDDRWEEVNFTGPNPAAIRTLMCMEIEAALLSVRNETIEEAAKVAEKHPVPRATWGITTRGEITKKIRSLRGEDKEKDGK